ncbi:cobalt-precorrin-5B (C(1))-methyltransferase [Methyloceanibacter caenitepidi]|uniref:Cobalt-precorrin-5B C(1)-methyltransferase n=1 Tax=Methyloceanibacter caenitepidi TaxID=1384459 RepID=A0A0A8JZA4_9HYPH|nr:cobalt-precorrin-5B (C(1))-methyltransferase [Methyloceanibacter caenitepidi]BAQ15865.1 cobalt-precorrin-6 synthase, anaerobic [Methyloceanibacter caenitepidi]
MKEEDRPLRKGWTTGACATAAAKAAYTALLTGSFPDPVEITLPGKQRPAFALATAEADAASATVGVVKDAGDDPDVTHGALVLAIVKRGSPGAGVTFRAGEGVGTVTKAGLPIPPGEPAINPVPRKMMRDALAEVADENGVACDVEVEIGVANGKALAAKTLNGRLGIVGGLSILGTTGIVVPYSCAAWIHSIHRGVDVARAAGLDHIAASTGSASERAVQDLYGLSETALIDMGDFVGGTLKYVKLHPVPRVTIAGGVAKMTKLAQGLLDLHSKRGSVDLEALASFARAAGGSADLSARIEAANTAAEAFGLAAADHVPLGDEVARAAQGTALKVVTGKPVAVEVVVFDRQGQLVGRAPFAHAGPPR